MLYQIPKNPGISFSKIPGSGFQSNPRISRDPAGAWTSVNSCHPANPLPIKIYLNFDQRSMIRNLNWKVVLQCMPDHSEDAHLWIPVNNWQSQTDKSNLVYLCAWIIETISFGLHSANKSCQVFCTLGPNRFGGLQHYVQRLNSLRPYVSESKKMWRTDGRTRYLEDV